MKKVIAFLAVSLGACWAPAHALDVMPYTSQMFAAKQKAGEMVALHFHATWCPTCRVQEKAFNALKGDASVPGTLLVAGHHFVLEF